MAQQKSVDKVGCPGDAVAPGPAETNYELHAKTVLGQCLKFKIPCQTKS